MPIAREILNMFEYSRSQKVALSVDNHFYECPLSQQRSVPTDRQTLLMHRYLQSQGSVHSVGTPLDAQVYGIVVEVSHNQAISNLIVMA